MAKLRGTQGGRAGSVEAGRAGAESVLVLGVGNILLRDEGLGVRTVEYIQANYSVPEGVEVVDGGTGGLALISVIRGYERLVIIDAVATGSPAGTIHRIDGERLRSSPPLGATAHQLGVRDMLAIAGLEGLTPEVVVIGVEPFDISAGLELSERMSAIVPEIASAVAGELASCGYELKENKSA